MHTEFTGYLQYNCTPTTDGRSQHGREKGWRQQQCRLMDGSDVVQEHSMKLNTIAHLHDLPQNIQATTEGRLYWGWVTPTIGETQHCNMLCATHHKTFKQRWKIVHTKVGYPTHLMKLNTIICYVWFTTKLSSNDRRSFTPGLGKPHTR